MLLNYKTNNKFDSERDGYRQLVDIELSQFDINTVSEAGHTIVLNQQESAILSQMEDASDNLNRDI